MAITTASTKDPETYRMGIYVDVLDAEGNVEQHGQIIASVTTRELMVDVEEIGISDPQVSIRTLYTVLPVTDDGDKTGAPAFPVYHESLREV